MCIHYIKETNILLSLQTFGKQTFIAILDKKRLLYKLCTILNQSHERPDVAQVVVIELRNAE